MFENHLMLLGQTSPNKRTESKAIQIRINSKHVSKHMYMYGSNFPKIDNFSMSNLRATVDLFLSNFFNAKMNKRAVRP